MRPYLLIQAVNPSEYISPKYWPTWLALLLLRIIIFLPLPIIEFFGALLGKLLHFALAERRTIADINLRIAFPDADAKEILRRRKLCFKNMGMAGFELALSWWQDKRLLDLCEIEGLENISNIQKEGRGVIILTAHFTCLEIGGPVLNHYIPFQVMYKKAHNKLFDAFMRYHRGRLYQAIVDYHKPISMIKGLKKGNAAWYAPDQDFRGKNMIFTPFFGVQASALTAPARFAKIANAAVVPYYIMRKPNGAGYKLVIFPALENFPSGNIEDDVKVINETLEFLIMKNPDQYLWVHKRYKNRPEGESRIYPETAKEKRKRLLKRGH